MDMLKDLVVKATLQAASPEARKAAEGQIFLLFNENHSAFLLGLAALVQEDDLEPQVRVAAGTMLARFLQLTDAHGKAAWFYLEARGQEQVKELLLATLINKDRAVSRTCSNVISVIFRLTQPGNGWPGLVPVMVTNCSNENSSFRGAAIVTLGFICEQIKRGGLAVEPATQESIMSGVLMAFKAAGEPAWQRNSLEALRDSIPSLKAVLSKPEIKNYVLKMLGDSLSHPDYEL
jgi:hypothetical protein